MFNKDHNMLWGIFIQILLAYLTYVFVYLIYTLIRILKNYLLPKIIKINLRKRYGPWAVITGGTRGIGRAYANELAKRGINIFIISIGMEDLKETAEDLRQKHGVETEILEINFTDGIEIYKEIEDKLKGKDIGVLVNNVGVALDKLKPFSCVSLRESSCLISINITAATLMTNIILPQMMKNGKGAVINLSSMSSYGPMSYMGLYSASKSYIRFFSKSLEDELRGSGITVQTVTPFYVSTVMTSVLKGMGEPSFFIPSAEDFVASAITTLGHAGETCGYAPHELIGYSMGLLPEWALVWLMGQINPLMNLEELKTK